MCRSMDLYGPEKSYGVGIELNIEKPMIDILVVRNVE